MNPTTVIDKKTLNLQYITDESGNKTAAILAVDHLDKLLNQLTDFAKRIEILSKNARQNDISKSTSQEKEASPVSPTETDNRLIEQQINLVTQHYDFINKLLMELQRYLEIKTEVDRKLHYQRVLEQLEAELQEVRLQLVELKRQNRIAPLYNVPEVPTNFILPSIFKELKGHLIIPPKEGGKLPLLLEGPCGSGKSSLMAAIVRDEEVRQNFPDGIFWITLGKDSILLDSLNFMIQTLSNSPNLGFVDIDGATEYLKKLSTTQNCLLVLDDVWDAQEVLAFNLSSEHSQLAMTTNDSGLLNILHYFMPNARGYVLNPLPEKFAQDLFNQWLNKKDITAALTSQLPQITTVCGHLPMALKLSAYLAHINPKTLLDDLNSQDYELSEHYPRSLINVLHTSVNSLGEQADYYFTLAVFPDYNHIPQGPVLMLWRYLYQLLDDQVYAFIDELARRGLIEIEGKSSKRILRLHSFQHDYLRAEAELEKLHNHLLVAYRRLCGQHGWLSGPNDGYFFEYLAWHLVNANRKNELRSLLLDFDWIHKKLQINSLSKLLHDYDLLEEDKEIDILKRVLYEAAPVLLENKSQLSVQLLDRLWGEKNLQNNRDIQALLNQAREVSPNWVWQPHFEESILKKV